MTRSGKERAVQAARVRALRWRFVVMAVLLLAACARWPLSGASKAQATPEPVSTSGHGATERSTDSIGNHADNIDERRTASAASREGRTSVGVDAQARHGRGPGGAIRQSAPGTGVRYVDVTSAATDSATPPAVTDGAGDRAPADLGLGAPRSTSVGTADHKALAHPGATASIAGTPVESGAFEEVNQRAMPWLAGIAATLLLLFIVGRRRRRPRRVRKMNTHTSERTGPRTSPLSPNGRATDKPRVRMFSAREIYAPTHDSHRGPWEAAVTMERGFAHRYQVAAQVEDGLLFVPASEPAPADMSGSSQSESEATASFVAPLPVPSMATPPSEPLVFSQAIAGTVQPTGRTDAAFEKRASDEPHSVVQTVTSARLADAAIPGPTLTDTIRPASRVRAATADRAMPDATPASTKATASTGTTMLDPAEFFANVPRKPAAGTAGAVPAPSQAPAPLPSMHVHDPVAEARRLVEAGDHAAALKHLVGTVQSAHPPEDVWRLLALCWWQVARADGAANAYANAADAMDRLLERDPSQTDLWYRTGSCRLLQASGERGAAQRVTLDLAVSALGRATAKSGHDDPLHALTLGDALFERAVAATDEPAAARAQRMAQATQLFREAARNARDPASMASWKLQQALQAQASLVTSTEASRLRMEADAVLAGGVQAVAEDERVVWLAARVENELAHAELAEGATRTLHLRTFRENHRDLLTGPDAAPELLLSWLELLALETGHLRGEAARSRFDEGEAILKRLDDALPGNAHVALARVRLLHRRAMQSSAGSRHAVLSDAIAGLMRMLERSDAPQLQMEVAELLLDRASGAPSMQAAEDCAHAEGMASGLLEHPMFALEAARCVLQARLGQSSSAVEAAVYRRVEALAGEDVRSRGLLAQAALRNGAAREACGHCEVAARSGARLDQAFIQLWDQASRQWSTTLNNPKDPAWLANRQSLRSAS